MADTAMWEVAKRRADTLSRDGAAGSRLMLEPILDEIRLLGPDAFEAACCRSLLRVFAADFAEREGVTIDQEQAGRRRRRVQDQPEPRTGHRARRGSWPTTSCRHEDFDRLVVTDEMVRWACGQAEPDAFGASPRRSAPERGVRAAGGQGQGQAGRRRAAGRTCRIARRSRPPSSGTSLSGAARRSRTTWQATRDPAGSRTSRPSGRPSGASIGTCSRSDGHRSQLRGMRHDGCGNHRSAGRRARRGPAPR